MTPLISIVTPCYNSVNVIAETIDSVLNQTFTDWEMLIVDDCSTDNSNRIIEDYIAKDSRIKYYKTDSPSGSPALPRNIGIDNASGKYIAFLDADDIWLPTKLEKQITFMEEKNISFCYSDYEKMNDKGERHKRIIRMPKKASFWDVIETCIIPCLTVIIRKDLIGNTRFKDKPKEDWIFWLDILKKNVLAYNCYEVLALYREQKKSRSANKLSMIRNQWFVLRNVEGVKPFLSCYFMLIYIIHGLIKFLK